jgi:hypothetical protein
MEGHLGWGGLGACHEPLVPRWGGHRYRPRRREHRCGRARTGDERCRSSPVRWPWGDVVWGCAPGSGGSVAVVVAVAGWLEVMLVEVAGHRGAELDALEVGGAEVDAGPDACVDVFL